MRPFTMARTSYFIGLLFLITSIIYFFAYNWAGLDRYQKLLLVICLLCLFYGLSYLFAKWKPWQEEVGKWIFWCGTLSFGVALALVDQIYNAHANSYTIFLIWLLPAVLLVIATRYHLFILLSYILLHMSIYTYYFPIQFSSTIEFNEIIILNIGIALLNLLFFYLSVRRELKLISYLSLLCLFSSAIWATAGWTIRFLYSGETNFLFGMATYIFFAALMSWLLFDLYMRLRQKGLLVTGTLGVAAVLLIQFVIVTIKISGESVYIISIIFALALVIAATILIKRLRDKASTSSGGPFADKEMLASIISLFVTVMVVLVITISFFGLLALANIHFDTLKLVSYCMLVFVPIGVLLKREHTIIHYVTLLAGLLISTIFIDSQTLPLQLLYLAVIIFASWRELGRISYPLLLFAGNYGLVAVCDSIVNRMTSSEILILLIVVNLALYGFLREKFSKSWSFIVVCLAWLLLTFVSESGTIEYYVYNSTYLVFLIGFSYKLTKRHAHWLEFAVYPFLVGYTAYKYYDLFWSLFHKSITFAIAGLLFLLMALYFDKKPENFKISNTQPFLTHGWKKWLPIVLLQIAIIAGISIQKESILQNGTEIWLDIEPIDPRSMLQGDYVALSFSISQLPNEYDEYKKQRTYVLLQPDEEGLYQISHYYRNKETAQQKKKQNQVMITGIAYGNEIRYGIESFFVEEGKGLELEQKAKFARVKVGKNGNAILQKVVAEK